MTPKRKQNRFHIPPQPSVRECQGAVPRRSPKGSNVRSSLAMTLHRQAGQKLFEVQGKVVRQILVSCRSNKEEITNFASAHGLACLQSAFRRCRHSYLNVSCFLCAIAVANPSLMLLYAAMSCHDTDYRMALRNEKELPEKLADSIDKRNLKSSCLSRATHFQR